jgi:hypothetical protein
MEHMIIELLPVDHRSWYVFLFVQHVITKLLLWHIITKLLVVEHIITKFHVTGYTVCFLRSARYRTSVCDTNIKCALLQSRQTCSGARSAYLLAIAGLYLRVKRPGRQVELLPPPSADVKEWVEPLLYFPHMSSWRVRGTSPCLCFP